MAPIAVEHYRKINSASALGVTKEDFPVFNVLLVVEGTSLIETATKGSLEIKLAGECTTYE